MRCFILGMACFSISILSAQAGEKILVEGSRVNIRAKANNHCEVVTQADFGDQLIARSWQEEWVEIEPPQGVSFWVHGEFLQGDTVKVETLNVRAGSSANYSVVGTLKRHDTVKRAGSFNEWVEIAPPKGSSLWISRKYVKKVEPPKPRVVAVKPKPKPAPRPPPRVSPPVQVAPSAPPVRVMEVVDAPPVAPLPPKPKDLSLIPLEGQGKLVQREGVVKAYLFAGGRPSRYQLRDEFGDRSETVCYIKQTKQALKPFVGRRVVIQGHEYWTQGETRPIIVPKAIVAVAE